MTKTGLQFLRPFIYDVIKAQAVFSEAKARGCSAPVLRVLEEHFNRAKENLDRVMEEAK